MNKIDLKKFNLTKEDIVFCKEHWDVYYDLSKLYEPKKYKPKNEIEKRLMKIILG